MIQIEKLEIRYFRSIYKAVIKDLGDLAVLSGRNDCGKSNVLRALNMFFNNHSDWQTPADFSQDFCRKRLLECREQFKTKQFIEVKVHFVRGNRFVKSLPKTFWVAKRWYRDARTDTRNSMKEDNVPAQSLHRAQASLSKYLDTIRFEYVPAIKDRHFFNYSLGILQDAILKSRQDESLQKAISDLNNTVRAEANELHDEFETVSGVGIDIHLPENLEALFRAFAISTGKKQQFPLSVRGDGIQTRFIPSLLHHVAVQSKKFYIWGFEEPENCLEHGLATQLANDMANEYSTESQILVTSHSPAFIFADHDKMTAFRVCSVDGDGTTVHSFDSDGTNELKLKDELGLLELQRKHQEEYEEERNRLLSENKRLGEIESQYNDSTSPILLVEGQTDVLILQEAWGRLWNGEPPFRILSCDVSGEDEDSKAGCGVLKKALESGRLDHPKTIGLLDYDEAGLDAFKLDRNFTPSDFSESVKLHSNGHFAGMVYPEIDGLKAYRNADNLCIEFLFPEECITKTVSGHGLTLKPQKRSIKVGKRPERTEDTTEPELRTIKRSSKTHFAEKVVPTFPDDAFENFEPVFELIEQTFDELS